MSLYYQQHVFVCVNQKSDGKPCCANGQDDTFFRHMKQQVNVLGLSQSKGIRVSKSLCLGRCAVGPCVVIYPEGIWFTYSSFDDIDDIVQQYLMQGQVVSRLLIAPE